RSPLALRELDATAGVPNSSTSAVSASSRLDGLARPVSLAFLRGPGRADPADAPEADAPASDSRASDAPASDVSCAGASAGEPADSACDGDCSGCWTSSVPSVPSAWVGRGLRRPATFGRRAGVGAGPAGCGVGLRRFGGTNGTPILRDYCWPA